MSKSNEIKANACTNGKIPMKNSNLEIRDTTEGKTLVELEAKTGDLVGYIGSRGITEHTIGEVFGETYFSANGTCQALMGNLSSWKMIKCFELPIRETETLEVFYNKGFGVAESDGTTWPATHKISFETVDGVPILDSIRMEAVVELGTDCDAEGVPFW